MLRLAISKQVSDRKIHQKPELRGWIISDHKHIQCAPFPSDTDHQLRAPWNFFTHQTEKKKESNSNPSVSDISKMVWWSGEREEWWKCFTNNLTLICRPFLLFILINISVWFLDLPSAALISIRSIAASTVTHQRWNSMWVWLINTAANASFQFFWICHPVCRGLFNIAGKSGIPFMISQKFLE